MPLIEPLTVPVVCVLSYVLEPSVKVATSDFLVIRPEIDTIGKIK